MLRARFVFPYGQAVLALLVVAIISGTLLLKAEHRPAEQPPDLVFALFARLHHQAYEQVVPEFERQHHVKVRMQLVPARGLQSRLQSALLVGAPVPDVVEILNGSMGYFTKGPLEDVGFVDLTQRLHDEGLYDRMVAARFSLWSSRGHIFAMPHDVHPVALAYRRDLAARFRIDVDELDTWDKFVKVGQRVTRDLDGDGIPDRYMMDLPSDGKGAIDLLLSQRGGGLFNAQGEVTLDSELAADTLIWYIHQTRGDRKISFPAGWGQTLAKAMYDGLAVFYFCPDWRTMTFQDEEPKLSGKMALIPLPAWEPGGRRTSTWGGTGLAITKQCQNQELAWEFAKFLYLQPEALGDRFEKLNILPPLKDAWDLPAFQRPREYWGGQAIGSLLASLAPEIPPDYVNPYTELARNKLSESFLNSALYYEQHGSDGLAKFVRTELKRNADYVREVVARNRFLSGAEGVAR